MTEVEIYDWEVEEVVGRIDDEGELVDAEEYLEEVFYEWNSFDEGVSILWSVDEHGDGMLLVEPGDEGYHRAVIDKLPSPFDAAPSTNLQDLPSYDPDSSDWE